MLKLVDMLFGGTKETLTIQVTWSLTEYQARGKPHRHFFKNHYSFDRTVVAYAYDLFPRSEYEKIIIHCLKIIRDNELSTKKYGTDSFTDANGEEQVIEWDKVKYSCF